MICCVVATVAGIYYFQYWITQPERNDILVLGAVNLTSIVATLMNTVVIVVRGAFLPPNVLHLGSILCLSSPRRC